jgi:hypothetical protein
MTNHKDLLPGLDGRSATARRFRDLVNAFVADMGGLDHCSEIKLGLVRRLAATATVAGIEPVTIMSGCRPTNSCASTRIRLMSPPPQRRSIRTLCPSVQPRSAST